MILFFYYPPLFLTWFCYYLSFNSITEITSELIMILEITILAYYNSVKISKWFQFRKKNNKIITRSVILYSKQLHFIIYYYVFFFQSLIFSNDTNFQLFFAFYIFMLNIYIFVKYFPELFFVVPDWILLIWMIIYQI